MTIGSSHLVTTESRELCFGVTHANLRNERCRMRVSRRFSCYYKVTTHA